MDAFINLIKFNPTSQYISECNNEIYFKFCNTNSHTPYKTARSTFHLLQSLPHSPSLVSSCVPCSPFTLLECLQKKIENVWQHQIIIIFFLQSLFLKMNVHVCTSMYHVLYGTIIDWNVKYIVRLFFSHYTNILI